MENPPQPEYPDRMNSFLTTEHFTLQSARSILNSEIVSRVNIYFTTLSSVIIAAAFLAQIEEMNRLFAIFIAIAFPMVILLGFFTFARLMLLGNLDKVYIRAINRIRQFYVRAVPEAGQFLLFPPYDDDLSVSKYGGYDTSMRGNLLSSTSTVIVANTVVATVVIGAFITGYFDLTVWQFLPLGIPLLIGIYFLHPLFGLAVTRRYLRQEYQEVRFPDPSGSGASSGG